MFAILFCAGFAFADEEKTIPTKQGFFYDMEEATLDHLTSVTILSKAGVDLDCFYINKNKVGLGLTYHIANLSKFLEVPIAEFVDISIGYAFAVREPFDQSREIRHGILANIVKIEIKF